MATVAETLEMAAVRCEGAVGPDRSIDRAVGYAIGLGVEKERKMYAEMGDAMWVPTPELKGLTPYDRARGSTVRSEWVKGSRGRKGHYQDVRWGACDGPQPLTNSPQFTASLDAAMTLVPEGYFTSFTDAARKPRANVWKPSALRDTPPPYVSAATPALALCVAALRAAAAKAREVRS